MTNNFPARRVEILDPKTKTGKIAIENRSTLSKKIAFVHRAMASF